MVDYKLDNINVRWKSVYYGEMKVAERFWSKDADFQTYGGTVIHDVEAGYSFMDESLKLTIGANNLLDTYPDKRYKSQSKLGELPYSGYQPFGFLGRYVYTRLDYKFE